MSEHEIEHVLSPVRIFKPVDPADVVDVVGEFPVPRCPEARKVLAVGAI
jgi:hypothetical protein